MNECTHSLLIWFVACHFFKFREYMNWSNSILINNLFLPSMITKNVWANVRRIWEWKVNITIDWALGMRASQLTKAAFRLGARARTLCPGTKRNAVQTPWCPKFHFDLLQCCHLVTATTSNHSETWVKSMALMKSCADKCPWDGAWILPSERVPVPGYHAQVLYGHH